jgi:predicted DNA-binding protein
MPDDKLMITPKMPRGDDGYKTFSIRVKDELVIKIDEISAKTGRSRNALIGTFLEYALRNCEIASPK